MLHLTTHDDTPCNCDGLSRVFFPEMRAKLVHPCEGCSVKVKVKREPSSLKGGRMRLNTGTTDGAAQNTFHTAHKSQIQVPTVCNSTLQKQRKQGQFLGGLFGFCQHPRFARNPPCRNHEPLCETTFPHGCVVEPFPQAHPPLYSSLALFDKVQPDETLDSIQRDLEKKPCKNCGKVRKTGQMVKNKVSSFGTKKYAADHKNVKLFFDLWLSALPIAFSITCCLEWFRAFNEPRSFAI